MERSDCWQYAVKRAKISASVEGARAGGTCVPQHPRTVQTTLKVDANKLVLALNVFFTTKSRTKMVAIARSQTRRTIENKELLREMITAMDMLAGCFPRGSGKPAKNLGPEMLW
jgi:hypothetical protein